MISEGYLDGRESIYLEQLAMGGILYLANHAAVMTPLVVETALQRCPVGTRDQRAAYGRELHTMGIRPDVNPMTGVADDTDRRRFHHIRDELRALGLPLFRQKAIWPRLQSQWDLFWGVSGKLGRDTLLAVPAGDVQAIIAANQAPYPFVPDLAVRFLLRKRDSEAKSGTSNVYVDAELLRIAARDPLRLYSRLGTAFYLDVLGKSDVEDAGRMVGDLMIRGLSRFDGRVIPMVSEVAERFPRAFTAEQMPALVQLVQKFPALEAEFIKFRNKPELLAAALAACFDEHGRLVVRGGVAGVVYDIFSRSSDSGSLKDELIEIVRHKDEANWCAYAILQYTRPDRSKQSVFFEIWQGMDLGKFPPNFAHYSTPELMDLLVYLEFDNSDSRLNFLGNHVRDYLSHQRHDQISEKLFLFNEEAFKRSSKISILAGEIMASHRPQEIH